MKVSVLPFLFPFFSYSYLPIVLINPIQFFGNKTNSRVSDCTVTPFTSRTFWTTVVDQGVKEGIRRVVSVFRVRPRSLLKLRCYSRRPLVDCRLRLGTDSPLTLANKYYRGRLPKYGVHQLKEVEGWLCFR